VNECGEKREGDKDTRGIEQRKKTGARESVDLQTAFAAA
jgi:hypothetical protein